MSLFFYTLSLPHLSLYLKIVLFFSHNKLSLVFRQVLDTIVEKVQNTENDDIAVLLLGYEKQMREMLRNQNPGLARRFSSDYPFQFEDYKQHELLKILKFVCKKENIIITTQVSKDSEVRLNNTKESVLYYIRKNHNDFTLLHPRKKDSFLINVISIINRSNLINHTPKFKLS